MSIIYDDYNAHLVGGGVVGTVTQTFGHGAWRNGIKMIEVYEI